jgi:hypothetical protein
MIYVSQDYMNKSLAPGRSVKCKIVTDERTFTDADIISFEFNDVVHPDDMNFGTTCANRFNFEVWCRSNIPLTAVIRPFVGFAGENDDPDDIEYCPLGEFHITRRHRKREKYSITCYDRMYRLDARYRPTLLFPSTAADVLADIGEMYGFEVGFTPERDIIEYIPRLVTCREIIGYIAGLNGGFAKFDRSGILRLKKLEMCNFMLHRSHYNELSIKADPLEVRQIDFITESDTFSEGRGTKVTTYRQTNPFATKAITQRVFDEWNGFSYHGMTVKLRGLPYLESGESIMVQDDFENEYYHALISDYTLEYDGGLKARLISRSKNPIDDFDSPMTQQRMMEALSESLRIRYFNYVNERDVVIAQTSVPLLNINFNLETSTFIVFNAQFTVAANADCLMTLDYRINNAKLGQTPLVSLSANRPLSVCLYNCFEKIRPGRNTFSVTARVSTGRAVVEAKELIASISGQHMLSGGAQRPDININQEARRLEIRRIGLKARNITGMNLQTGFTSPGFKISEGINPRSITMKSLVRRNLNDALCMDAIFTEAEVISRNTVKLSLSNPFAFTGSAININAFSVGDGFSVVRVISVTADNNRIILNTESISELEVIVIEYNSDTGNLISTASLNPVKSFIYVIEQFEM